MIRRRQLLAASAAALAAPAIVERANAQSAFDWKQFKGQSIEVNYQLSPRGDLARAHLKEFEDLTGISAGFEQIPEQQQRPKVAMEMATGHPSFDVVNVGMHVQKRLIEKAKWMEDLRPFIADKSLTNPDFDLADFSKPSMQVATGDDGKINVLPLNQDLFIVFYNKELLAAKGFSGPPKTYDEMMSMAHALTDPSKQVYGFVGRGLKNANVVLYDNILLGWDQETVTPDGKKLLTDTPAAIEAGQWYQKIMKECGPPGNIGFNWNECQTTFMQGRGAMWWDGIGFSAPLLDKTKSRVVDKVGFAPVPAGPKSQSCRDIHRRHRHSGHREEQEARVAVPAMDRRQADAERAAPFRLRHATAVVVLRAGGHCEEQQLPAGMVRHDHHQPEDRPLRPAGDRAGDRIPRYDRHRPDEHCRRFGCGDGTEEGNGCVPAGAGQVERLTPYTSPATRERSASEAMPGEGPAA